MSVYLMGKSPVDFMREYKVQLAYDKVHGETAPIDLCTPGPVPDTLEFPSARPFNMGVKPGGTNATIFLSKQVGTADTFVRYLPWQPDKCTYVRMDDKAKIVFTGPLTGCNVYAAGPKDSPVLFHTNWNKDDADGVNNVTKRKMALDSLAANVCGLPPATVIGGQFERAKYSGTYYGFVFGVKEAGEWKFYFNGIAGTESMLSRFF